MLPANSSVLNLSDVAMHTVLPDLAVYALY